MKKVLLTILALILLGCSQENDDQITIFEGEVQLTGDNQSLEGLEIGISEITDCGLFSCDSNWKFYPLNKDGFFSIRITTTEAVVLNISVFTADKEQIVVDCLPGCFDFEPDNKHSNLILYAERRE